MTLCKITGDIPIDWDVNEAHPVTGEACHLGDMVYLFNQLSWIEAIRIQWDEVRVTQCAYSPENEEQLDWFRQSSKTDDPFTTIEIPGFPGDWAVFVYPYSSHASILRDIMR